MTETGDARTVGSHVTLKRLGILFGILIWAFLWFWPMLSNLDGTAYSGIDYVLRGEGDMADFFYFGVGVGLFVI